MRKTPGSLRTPIKRKQSPTKSSVNSVASSNINFIEELKTLENQMTPNTKYDIRINAIRRLLLLIDHGALQNQEFFNRIPTFHQGIISSITNTHNSSTKIASVLISKLAINLREQFEMMGNLIKPLSIQIAHRSQLIAESCSESLYMIAECCCTQKIMVQFGALCISRVPKVRLVASICFHKIVTSSSQKVIEECWPLLSNSLRILLSDPNRDMHSNSRKAIKHLSIIAPHLYEEIKPYLDSRIRKQMANEQKDIQKQKDIISKISKHSQASQSDDRDSRTSEDSSTSFSIDNFKLVASNDSLNQNILTSNDNLTFSNEDLSNNIDSPKGELNQSKSTKDYIQKFDKNGNRMNSNNALPFYSGLDQNQSKTEINNQTKLNLLLPIQVEINSKPTKTRLNQSNEISSDQFQNQNEINSNESQTEIYNAQTNSNYNEINNSNQTENDGNQTQIKNQNEANSNQSQDDENQTQTNSNYNVINSSQNHHEIISNQSENDGNQVRVDLHQDEINSNQSNNQNKVNTNQSNNQNKVNSNQSRNGIIKTEMKSNNNLTPLDLNQNKVNQSVSNSKNNSPRFKHSKPKRSNSVSVSQFDNIPQFKLTQEPQKFDDQSQLELISPHIQRYRSPSVYDPRKVKTTSVNLSIRQSNGHGRNFLNTIREMIEKGDTDVIGTNIKNVVDDVIKCCSLPILSVSAISVLGLLIPLYPNEFELKLNQIIPILLNASSKGSNRASDNAIKILRDLPNYYSVANLAYGLNHSYSSTRLLIYACFLVDLEQSKESDQISLVNDEKACFIFLKIALESYQIDVKKSAHIFDAIYSLNDKVVNKFLAGLSDKWRYKCQKHFQPILPHITFPSFRPISIPTFDPSSIDDIPNYIRHFIHLIESLHSFQWKMVHSEIFSQINKMMLLKSYCPPVVFTLTKNLLLQRGFDDIEEILPGLLKNLRNEQNSKGSQDILLLFCHFSDILLVFAEFEEMMMLNDIEIQLNAIDFASVIIRGTSKASLLPLLPELTSTLVELLASQTPEIRKASVFCYVSIFAVVGHSNMEQYTANLQPAQLKLILIYLDRLKEQEKSP